MAFECPRRSSPPSPMFDADTGCIATDPAPSARRRFRSKTGIENLPANEHAQETPHTPSPTRTTRRIQSGCAGSRPRLRDGMPGSPSQHIDITRAKWIPYLIITASALRNWIEFVVTEICQTVQLPAKSARAPGRKRWEAVSMSHYQRDLYQSRIGSKRTSVPLVTACPVNPRMNPQCEMTATRGQSSCSSMRARKSTQRT